MKTLRRGNSGEEVVILQSNLQTLNFYGSEINGIFDTNTESSVRQFQVAANLVVDGIVGPKTWAKIESELEKPSVEPKKLFVSEYGYVPDDGIPTVEDKPVTLSMLAGATVTLPAAVAMNLYQQLEKWIKNER